MLFLETLKHYLHLSLPQMHRPDFVLVVAAMHNRMSAFNSGFIKAKSKFDGAEVASNVSQLSMKEVEEAAKRKDSNLRVSGPANQLLNSISASCRPVGHSNEAAAEGRKKFFALSDYFGESSIFLTVTPDDENSFRVKMFSSPEAVSSRYLQS